MRAGGGAQCADVWGVAGDTMRCNCAVPQMMRAAGNTKSEAGRRELRQLKAQLARGQLERQLGPPHFATIVGCDWTGREMGGGGSGVAVAS